MELADLIDDALRLKSDVLARAGITLERRYVRLGTLLLERHKILQILLNLLENARHALSESRADPKRLAVTVEQGSEKIWVRVEDNGTGIKPDHMPRLFTQGFTTRQNGHGFGLHMSCLLAQEMGGALTCRSEGPERGATFTLELPAPRP